MDSKSNNNLTGCCGEIFSVTVFGCGFNRWMQQIDEIVRPVFRSLAFSLDAHSIVSPRH